MILLSLYFATNDQRIPLPLNQKQTMKYQLLIFIFLGMAHISCSQTWLSPVVGYDWMRVTTDAEPGTFNYIQVLDSGFTVRSPFLGAAIEQQLLKNVSLEYQFGFLRKDVGFFRFGAFPTLGLRFEQFRNTIFFKYRLNKYFFGAAGGHIHINRNTRVLLNGGANYELVDFFLNKGLAFQAGGNFKNIHISFWYHHGLNSYTITEGFTFLPSRSLSLSLSYRFKVLGRKKQR
jgi:hypothetical protein